MTLIIFIARIMVSLLGAIMSLCLENDVLFV